MEQKTAMQSRRVASTVWNRVKTNSSNTLIYSFLSFFQTGKTETCSKKIDLAIILDASASIDEDNFNLAKGFAKRLLKSFTISPDNCRVSIVSYSQRVNMRSRFSDDQDERKLEDILKNTSYEGSSTSTGKTIKFVNFEVFSTKFGSRIGNPGKQFTEESVQRKLIWRQDCSSQLHTHAALKLKLEKKKSGLTGYEPMTSMIPTRHCSNSYQANWELVTLWALNIPVDGEEYRWIYEISYIWTVLKDKKTWDRHCGRALDRYRRGDGSKSRSRLMFFML